MIELGMGIRCDSGQWEMGEDCWGVDGEFSYLFKRDTRKVCLFFVSDVITWTATIFLDREEISLEEQAAYWGDGRKSGNTWALHDIFEPLN